LYKYRINESYDTVPTDVGILRPKGGKELTVFACTDGLNGRWILRGTLIEQDDMLVLNRMRVKMD
jgi:sortase (surface protein transpeptidase)